MSPAESADHDAVSSAGAASLHSGGRGPLGVIYRGVRRVAWIIFAVVALLFVVRSGVLWAMQESVIFPLRVANAPPPVPPPQRAEVWTLDTDAGPVVAWLIPAPREEGDQAPGPAVVFCHGNAERVDFNVHIAEMYAQMGAATLLVEYRGYGSSAGKPSERALVADTLAFVRRLEARPEIDPDRIVYHGRSLGAGVLFQVADRRPPAAMLAESAFLSAVAMARRQLVPGFLLRHPFRSDRVAAKLEAPLLLLHGERDRIAPLSHAQRLHELATRSELFTQEAGHNDFPADFDAYVSRIEAFLRGAGALAMSEDLIRLRPEAPEVQ